jgi:hypothetical protein
MSQAFQIEAEQLCGQEGRDKILRKWEKDKVIWILTESSLLCSEVLERSSHALHPPRPDYEAHP